MKPKNPFKGFIGVITRGNNRHTTLSNQFRRNTRNWADRPDGARNIQKRKITANIAPMVANWLLALNQGKTQGR